MAVTVDCGEGKHDLCTGSGHTAYLFPQESRDLNEDPFGCGCGCHHRGRNGFRGVPCSGCYPDEVVVGRTRGGRVLTESDMAEFVLEAEVGYDVEQIGSNRRAL